MLFGPSPKKKKEESRRRKEEEKVSGPFSVVFSSPNWTIQLINPSNQQVLATTTTDANGRYQFVNLAAGNYTVAEVQQQGWTQRGPVPVPPGTYSETLAAGQAVYQQDFGNQWTGGPLTTTPPTGATIQPPVFGTTPPNPGSVVAGQTFVYNATATDPGNYYPLTFDLPVHPAGMAVDLQLGVLFWQPTASP